MLLGQGFYLNANLLFGQAKAAYGRTSGADSDTESGQLDALVAILFSAATLEAFIMEVALHAKHTAALVQGPATPIHALSSILEEAEASRGSVRLKYLLAKSVLSGETYDKGDRLYQEFDLLFRLRDMLVHMKPEKASEQPSKIVAPLVSRGLCEPGEARVIRSWIHQITTRAVARWACNLVVEMIDSIRATFPAASSSVNAYTILHFATAHFEPVE